MQSGGDRSGDLATDRQAVHRADRVHLGGHTNILKRLLSHAGGFNLGLLMRQLTGVGITCSDVREMAFTTRC